MKAVCLNDLYSRQPQYVTKDLTKIKDHIYESSFDEHRGLGYYGQKTFEENARVEIKIIDERIIDERRFWLLTSVWFDELPIMITQNAGREGDDHSERYISNYEAFKRLINYLRKLQNLNDNFSVDEMNTEIYFETLASFYGQDLD